jgi:hypothetical protein
MPGMQHPSARILLLIAIIGARAQVRDSALHPDYAARLEVIVQRGDTGEVVPARIYLFRSGEAHRLSPVTACSRSYRTTSTATASGA